MNITKTLASLACGTVATLASTGLAQAITPPTIYTSGSMTTVTGTGISGSRSAYIISPTDPLISGANHPYNTTSIPAPAEWVTAFQNPTTKQAESGINGGTYTFTQSFESVSSPFVLTGSLLSDNALEDIIYDAGLSDAQTYSIADLKALGDTYTADQSNSNSTAGDNSYKLDFNFGPVVGAGAAPDVHTLSFVVQNQNQGSSEGTYTNPASIDYSFNVAPAAVPEPGEMASFAIGGLGLLGLGLRARKARRTAGAPVA